MRWCVKSVFGTNITKLSNPEGVQQRQHGIYAQGFSTDRATKAKSHRRALATAASFIEKRNFLLFALTGEYPVNIRPSWGKFPERELLRRLSSSFIEKRNFQLFAPQGEDKVNLR